MAENGIPSLLLMEHAAQCVVQVLSTMVAPSATVLFLCGPGNNSGDGYAAARVWQASGGRSLIWELSDAPSKDAAINRNLALNSGIPILTLTSLPALPDCAAVVDALFGTGLSRPIEGLAATLIEAINRADLPVLAVDVPTGLDADTGRPHGCVLKANHTVTFHRMKQGLALADADLVG